MRRNMDLVREILLAVEDSDAAVANIRDLSVEGYEQERVSEHVKLLLDDGYLEGNYKTGSTGGITFTHIRSLTNKGHDFLQAARNETVWEKGKQAFQEKSLNLTMKAMEEALKKYVSAKLEE